MQLEVELLHSFLAFTVYVILKQLTIFCLVFLDSVYLFNKDGLFENNHCFCNLARYLLVAQKN